LFEDLLVTYGYLGVLLVSLAVNLLPFSSPSNLILAGAVTFLFPGMNPLPVGLAVAVAASIAKTAHYYVASYMGAKAGNKAGRLESYGRRLGDGVHLQHSSLLQLQSPMIRSSFHSQ